MQLPAPVRAEGHRHAALRVAAGTGLGLMLMLPLGWLLGRLVWLWFYFGLFFFLLAGLLVGSLVFRLLRPLRPRNKPFILPLCAVLGLVGWLASIHFEYRHVAHTIGEPPKFARARTAFASAGLNTRDANGYIEQAFDDALQREFAPGGLRGYVRWTLSNRALELRIPYIAAVKAGPFADQGDVRHGGYRWPVRAVVALALLIAGMWWQLSDLAKPLAVNNMIDPDLGDELEREELHEAGEPGFMIFEHTADLGLEARGRNWPGLLEQAALGLMATIGRLQPVPRTARTIRIEVNALTREDLLRDWLAELLYRFETENLMVTKVKCAQATNDHIDASVTCHQIDREASIMRREVKAVTYHDLSITPIKRGLSARVILDI